MLAQVVRVGRRPEWALGVLETAAVDVNVCGCSPRVTEGGSAMLDFADEMQLLGNSTLHSSSNSSGILVGGKGTTEGGSGLAAGAGAGAGKE